MKRGLILLAALSLSACATTAPLVDADRLFADHQFAARSKVPGADEIFALTPEMRAYLLRGMKSGDRGQSSPAYALHEMVHQDLKLDYDTELTRTAAEAFDARAGNCLSLVVLTAALARELQLPISFQSVHGFETWSRAEGVAFLSGHVNLLLNSYPRLSSAGAVPFERELVIDFVEDARRTVTHSRAVEQATIVSMFLNNRAAELLINGQIDAAYWHARAAMLSDPLYLSAYNTLAVIYLRHGNLPAAERVLMTALKREPANVRMLGNLANVLARSDRREEAAAIQRRLAELESVAPYFYLDKGKEALAAGDSAAALELFRKELKRIPYDHELHFAIALAELKHGEVPQAREHLTLAMRNSGSRNQRALYASKLEHLKAIEVH